MPKSEVPTPYAEIGERLRGLRRIKDVTQTELGRQVHASQPTISQWEKGTRLPGKAMQFRIADFFQVNKSMLFAEAPDGFNERAA